MPKPRRQVLVCVNERPAESPKGSCGRKGGQALFDRLRALLRERGLATRLEVDGGVTVDNIHELAGDGADTFVSGSGILRSERFGHDYAAAISAMRARAEAAMTWRDPA